jgi:hypothetical protein
VQAIGSLNTHSGNAAIEKMVVTPKDARNFAA